MLDWVFIFSGILCLGSACAIVTRKNPVYSVIFMLPFFLGMTILFVILSAPFLAAMQMMVYGGAILILFLFVIMLINLRPEEIKDDFSLAGYAPPAVIGGLLGGLVLSFVHRAIPPDSPMETAFSQPVVPDPKTNPELVRSMLELGRGGPPPELGSIDSLSLPLFKLYIIPFELVSILIVVAMLGAVVLSKKRLSQKPENGAVTEPRP